MQQFLSAIGRKCSVVNLDPANDRTSYPCALDVRDLVTLEEVMAEEELGPNGGVLYALEELEHNGEWLDEGLRGLGEDYVLFDCPGQVELFTHHSSLRNLFLGYRSLAMLQMDLPHLNVMTKIDKLASYGPLPFNLDFYTEVQDLSYLLPHLANENPVMRHPKFEGLNNAVVELVEDFGLVGFETLAVEDKKSMMTLLQAIDRAGGYAFGGAEGANDTVWQVAMREGMTGMTIHDVQERWIDRKEEFDELEAKEREEEARAQETPPLTEDGGEEDSDVEEMGPVPDSGVKVLRRS
ncbi:hypothetical protein HO173_005636 [Letharia columbiana]|uniref:GPN-loop GTPase 2 n=1 Tax=Letharia columbiana TaxID=112416 RepID=A0A8H6FWA8_9LECA|nr:uncharacterized protein HO173_005636 [Letharia columbiana]KAF6236008.1 hypothetical protein HO173_005636 [Letharia columbiana]